MSLPSDELPLAVTSGSASETSNAVSRALQIVDIVQEILEWLCPPLLTLSDYLAFIPTRKIFLHTALSCHTFLEPSLNILWRSMHSIFPLLKLLPTECFHERNGEYVLNGLPLGHASDHWHRIQYYAQRVTAFYHDVISLPTPYLAFHTCNAITHYFPSNLLPNLGTLHVGSSTLTSSAVLFTVLSPSLRRVEIPNVDEENRNQVDSLLTCLLGKSIHVQHLTLGGVCPDQALQLAGYLKSLVSLDMVLEGTTLQSTVQRIAHLPCMKTLKLNFDCDMGHQLRATVWSAPLANLTLEGGIPHLYTFLNNNQIPHVRQINLKFVLSQRSDNSNIWGDDFKFIPIVISRLLDVQDVIMDTQCLQTSPPLPSLPMFRDIVLPLTAQTQLKSLDIFSSAFGSRVPQVALTSADYRVIADTFPALEHLALSQANVMTFEDLYSIALRCPRLRYLGVGINTQTFPVLPSAHNPPITHNLETLSVGDSPLHDIHHATRHIHRIFPRLQKVDAVQTEWKTVQSLLELYQSMTMDNSDRRAAASVLADELEAERARNLLVASRVIEAAQSCPSFANGPLEEAPSAADQTEAGGAPDLPVASMDIAPSSSSSNFGASHSALVSDDDLGVKVLKKKKKGTKTKSRIGSYY